MDRPRAELPAADAERSSAMVVRPPQPLGPPRVLSPQTTKPRRFPLVASILLIAATLVSIPTELDGSSGSAVVHVVAKIVAVLAACSIAFWCEQRLYRRLWGSGRLARLILHTLAPFFLFGVGALVALVTGMVGALLHDDGTLAIAAGVAGLWAACAALGSWVIVFIDVIISTFIPDFRSRVQTAVLALLGIGATVAVGVYVAGRAIAQQTIEIQRARWADDQDININLGEGPLSHDEAMRLLDMPETPDFLASLFLISTVVMMLPAILSATGKLADAVMERLTPLSEAIDEVTAGRLDMRVEEGGSRDFVKISRGFNRMTESLHATMTNLDARNHDLAEMNQASSRFVPYQFLELLRKESIRDIHRGDQVQLEIAVMFADIRDFTTMAEAMGPAATFQFINRYLGHMEREIHQEGGFINDFAGDGIMALFHGGPDAALRAAIGMLEQLPAINAEREEPIRIGIGIHTGPLMLGTIGGRQRLACTVIGDVANTASRIEGLTKIYGASLLVGESVVRGLADPSRYEIREVDRVQVKGKRDSVAIFEVLDGEAPGRRLQKQRTLGCFGDALEAYRDGELDEALRGFERCREDAPDDVVATLYLERCRRLQRDGVPEEWSAVTRMSTK